MDKRNHSLFTILTFSKISTKRFFRDRVAMFFTVVFPLIFLLIFGGIFGKDNSVSFHVGLINKSDTQFSQKFASDIKNQSKLFKVNAEVSTLEVAREKMSRSELDATIILPVGFGALDSSGLSTGVVNVYYNQNSQQAATTVSSLLKSQLDQVNLQLTGVVPPFSIEQISINQKSLNRFDYTFAGMIGFAILGLGLFGPVNYFPQMKKQGILRRLHITPIRVWEYFTASVISNALIGLFSIAVMFVVAFLWFDFSLAGNIAELMVVVTLGIILIFGIGLAIGGWAKNENQAAPLANIIAFPMMFLSGTFFPRFLMPEWLQSVTAFLPLTPVIDSIRLVATEGKSLTEIGAQLGLMAIWIVVIYAIAFRVFRWE